MNYSSSMQEQILDIAGLKTHLVGAIAQAQPLLVLLHGYAMTPADLTPFAHSLQIPAVVLVPRGPHVSPTGGYCWWNIDTEARSVALAAGPRDLALEHPGGLPAARSQLADFMAAAAGQLHPCRTLVGGFSQGGMLACDQVLHVSSKIDGLIMMSASRIAGEDWQLRRAALHGLRTFISHGRTDLDLSFAAGESLRDFMVSNQAKVTWVPFDQGHEIPLVVWRELRKFIRAIIDSPV